MSSNNYKRKKENLYWIVWFITLIILIFIAKERGLAYFLGLAILWAIGRKVLFYIKEKGWEKKRKEKNILLNNLAIFIYIALYVSIMVIIYFDFLKKDAPFASTFILVMTYWFLYQGLIGIKTRRLYLRGFQLSKKAALVYGILMVIAALLFIIIPFIITLIAYLR